MMNQQTVNLDTYNLSLLTAKEDILNPRTSTNWALFSYDGVSNKLKLADSGVGGVTELACKFHASKPQYGLCRVGKTEKGEPQIALIIWVGENVDEFRKTECASHVPAIRQFFKEAHAVISAEKMDEVTEDKITAEISKIQAQAPSQWARRNSRSAEKEDLVGTNYRKTNAALEMRRINRDSFWARAEREEEQRKEEERRRATEERRRLEKERVEKERKDTEERDRKMNEKLQMIEEQRRRQAEQEEELRRKEKIKWEEQQKEHEEDMRARLRRSESIEKAAEAAVLVSQRSMNPREFFRQLSSSSSQSPTSPGSSRSGRPLRRYQRSLTDTAFIFSKAEDTTPSPLGSPLVSPFSRAPASPFYRTMSPPASPDFRPVTSPQRPMSPPTSPLRPTPPVSELPVQPPAEPQAPATVEPSAPPASPNLLTALSSSLAQKVDSQSVPGAPPSSPPNTPNEASQSSFDFEACPAPSASLPETSPEADFHQRVVQELVSDTGYIAHAVLVEEDEEEEEEEEEKKEVDEAQTETKSDVFTLETAEAVIAEEEDDEEEEEEQNFAMTEVEEVKEIRTEEEDEEEEEKDVEVEEEAVEEEGEVEEDEKEEDPASEEEPEEEVVVNEEEEEPRQKLVLSAPEEDLITEAEAICQKIINEAVVLTTNGVTNGGDTHEKNGLERSLSLSDTETGSPELAVSCDDCETVETDDQEDDDDEQGITENGDEGEHQICVRALYDYKAEDETEISFEPGDIITDVETVDKAWWRGWSKDGRQGLFPSNYVETI